MCFKVHIYFGFSFYLKKKKDNSGVIYFKYDTTKMNYIGTKIAQNRFRKLLGFAKKTKTCAK